MEGVRVENLCLVSDSNSPLGQRCILITMDAVWMLRLAQRCIMVGILAVWMSPLAQRWANVTLESFCKYAALRQRFTNRNKTFEHPIHLQFLNIISDFEIVHFFLLFVIWMLRMVHRWIFVCCYFRDISIVFIWMLPLAQHVANVWKFGQTIGIAPTLREPRLYFLDCHNSTYFNEAVAPIAQFTSMSRSARKACTARSQ